jgi:hypothetical protein
MKKIVLLGISALTFGFAAAQANQEPATPAPAAQTSKAKIEFVEKSHDFGNVIEGEIARYEFKFTNTGTEPLVLQNVQASCGCTTPKWPREPIAPGETAVIIAEYNSNGRPGTFNKQITVTSNGGDAVLSISGVVVQEASQPKSPVIIKQ